MLKKTMAMVLPTLSNDTDKGELRKGENIN